MRYEESISDVGLAIACHLDIEMSWSMTFVTPVIVGTTLQLLATETYMMSLLQM